MSTPVQRSARRHPHRAHDPGADRARRRRRSAGATDDDTEASLDELAALDRHRRRRRGRRGWCSAATTPDHTWFIGKGKAEELRELCLAVDADTVVFDNELSPAQQYNLEKLLGRTAIDRTAVILDIFAQNAHTLEGKAQVELALLRYRLPRLRRGAKAKLSQQRGGIGTRFGGGETKLEVDRRRIMRRITRLEQTSRSSAGPASCSASSRAAAGSPRSRIVGYTNAGKSTLLNTLTDAGVLVEDRLFATLDPTTRRLALPGGEPVLLTDTVGLRPPPAARARRGVQEHARGRQRRPTSWSTSSTPARPTREGQIDAVHDGARRDRRRRRARAARVQQGRPRPGRGQAARRRPPGLGRRQRGRRARASTTCSRTLGDRLRSLTTVVELPSRTSAATCSPRSTARARSSRRPTSPDGCPRPGPACRTPRPAGWPSSSSPAG